MAGSMVTEEQIEHAAKFLGSAGVIIAAMIAVWKKGVKPVWHFAGNVSDIIESLDAIKHQLVPNGGGSMRDAIDRIEARLIVQEQRHKLLTMDSPFAVFETDASGECIHVNRTYCRWTGRSAEELLGNGWLNVIGPGCRAHVFAEWETAIEQVREFCLEYSFVNVDGTQFMVRCNAFPMFDSKCRLSGWMGIITKT
jgi:PAS domain S-box-containing protein